MKRKYLYVISAVILGSLIGVSLVKAATVRDITRRLGGAPGDLFKIVASLYIEGNQFVTGSISNPKGPVKIADDLRVDGKLFRGSKAGTSDATPVVIDDKLQVNGSISGSVKYNNTKSGLSSTTIQDSIDEIGIKLNKLISGSTFSSSSVNTKATATTLKSTTWTGTVTYVDQSSQSAVDNIVKTSEPLRVEFAPTDKDAGSWSSTPKNVFAYTSDSDITGGNYRIAGESIIATYRKNAGYYVGKTCSVDISADQTMTLVCNSSVENSVIATLKLAD